MIWFGIVEVLFLWVVASTGLCNVWYVQFVEGWVFSYQLLFVCCPF
jgi:hypothetical protein